MTYHISEDALDWALAHIRRSGDTDIFPVPFEFEAIEDRWDEIKDHLHAQDLDTWICRSSRVCLTPKGRYAYRISTQLDPLDSLLFCALIYELGADLEASRIEPERKVVLSHRFMPTADGLLFDTNHNWGSFIDACRRRIEHPKVTHVVLADISDFFHRLYHHQLENALNRSTGGSDPARIMFKLVDQWAGTPSYGIPVGPSPSRLLAEITLDDVDRNLRSEGASFCRFSDDFRIFCSSTRDAYDKLSALAMALFEIHGLTLQPGKTRILEKDDFIAKYLTSPESEELSNLNEKFDQFLELVNLVGNRYEQIDYDDLEPDAQRIIDELNLEDLLREQLRNDPDFTLVRWILKRLAQLNDADMAVELIESAEQHYPVLSAILEYLGSLDGVGPDACATVGRTVMDLLSSSSVAHLPYHRCWLLSIFASNSQWGQSQRLARVYGRATDALTRRKAILALGRAKQDFWFRAHKGSAREMDPWQRRAFLAGISCMAGDERRYWYNSVKVWLDPLEAAVVAWVKQNPF